MHEPWWEHAKQESDFAKAVDLLRGELNGSVEDKDVTLWCIGRACFHAQRYKQSEDPAAVRRRELIGMKRTRVALARAARTLALSCETGDGPLKWALARVRANPAVHFGGPEGENLLSIGSIFFRELERALEGELPELNRGPFLSRFAVGNLLYQHALPSTGRPVEVVSMLAFELTLYLRKHQAGAPVRHGYEGAAMPTAGRPFFHIVAAFCNATLLTTDDGKQIAARVRKIPGGTCLRSWPARIKSNHNSAS